MSKRIRPIQVTVAVSVVMDDGDTLTPVEVQPVTLTVAQFADFDLAAQIASLQEQMDQGSNG